MHRLLAHMFFIFIFLVSSFSYAVWPPEKLNDDQLLKVHQVLAPINLPQASGDPVPMGGYEGFELGISSSYLNTSEISEFTGFPRSQTFPSVTIGKGFYSHFDFRIEISPGSISSQIQRYLGLLRWCYYQNGNFFSSLQVSGGSSSVHEKLNIRGAGAEILVSYLLKSWTLSAGMGRHGSLATFVGGGEGVTLSNNNERRSEQVGRVLGSISKSWGKFNVTLMTSKSASSNSSLLLAWRF